MSLPTTVTNQKSKQILTRSLNGRNFVGGFGCNNIRRFNERASIQVKIQCEPNHRKCVCQNTVFNKEMQVNFNKHITKNQK